jgi:hypothetical protein
MGNNSALLKKPPTAASLLCNPGRAGRWVSERIQALPRRKILIPAHKPKEETQLKRRWTTIDDSEQYALTAKGNGWYPCLHSRRINFYLKTNEVWKYGVARSGEFGRFKATFLIRNKVSYIVQFKGAFFPGVCDRNRSGCSTTATCRKNLARPPAQQLPRPPYNTDVPLAGVC